ncbi:hypothetical protein [Aliikangiella sp. G2MR2-5]|uniref:hypothetical protein n=1 Tax=Aliikangiella sp. G2MR2-5 TaxID=2788943 RepID=UPI0018A90FDA|nr:hypothetical protein [Aliikangiella sp. G2MR2-5]
METKANPEVESADSSNTADTIQSSIVKKLMAEETAKKESIPSGSVGTNNAQQLLKDMGLEESELVDILLAHRDRAGKAMPTVMNSVKDNAVAQVKQFGASTIASMIAILIAVVTPIILNSQFAQDIAETIADIRKQLPNEADDLLMSQVTDLSRNNQALITKISTEQRLLQAQNMEFSKGEQAFKDEYKQVTQKLVEIESQSKNLTDSLVKKIEELEGRIGTKNDKPNYALLKQLSNLISEGEKLVLNQAEKSERWFKRAFYTVQGLQKEAFNQQLKTHVAVLKSIAEKDEGYKEFNKRKEEALIVLDALSSLVNAAIIR